MGVSISLCVCLFLSLLHVISLLYAILTRYLLLSNVAGMGGGRGVALHLPEQASLMLFGI